jgi:sugar lactone lactonase YvrE
MEAEFGRGVLASGFGGDGGPATAAELFSPETVAVDAAGNLFIGESGNHRIRKVTPDGLITTVAGNGTSGFSGDGGAATAAQLAFPRGVAVDTAGHLYIGEGESGNRIRKVSPNGIITTVAGNGTAGFSGDGGPATSAQISNPRSVAVDAAGNLFIVDTHNHRIRRVSSNGIITTVAGNGTGGFSGDGGPATAAQLNFPQDVIVDMTGNLFIADLNDRIRKVSPDGVITTLAVNPGNGR